MRTDSHTTATAATPSVPEHLSGYLSGRWKPLVGALILGCTAQAVVLAQPILAGDLINAVQGNNAVSTQVIFLLVAAIVYAALISVQQAAIGRLGESVVQELRKGLVSRFFEMPTLAQESRPPGWYSARIVADPPLISKLISQAIIQFAQTIILLIGSTVGLLTIDAVTFCVALGFAVLSVVLTVLAARPIRGLRSSIQESTANITVTVQRAATSSRLLRAHNAVPTWQRLVATDVDNAYSAGVKLNRLYSYFGPISAMLMQFAYASTVVIGGYRVAVGNLGFADLVVFLMFFSLFSSTVSSLSTIVMQLQEASAGHQRLREFEKASKPESNLQVSTTQVPAGSISLVFDNVWFRYTDHEWALQGATFNAPAGRMTALVGGSGSGKSTCLGLVERFFDPERGRILISGVNSMTLNVAPLRERIGYVDQDAGALAGSVRENLSLGVGKRIDDQTMMRMLNRVSLTRLTRLGKKGLDASIGERGLSLSGGERQRLAIARAMLRTPSLLLLDEPTSSLDGVSESEVRHVLRDVRGEATVLLLAHRLSTILDADWIVVLDDGEVVDEGTHDTLTERCPRYRELVRSQLTLDRSTPLTSHDFG